MALPWLVCTCSLQLSPLSEKRNTIHLSLLSLPFLLSLSHSNPKVDTNLFVVSLSLPLSLFHFHSLIPAPESIRACLYMFSLPPSLPPSSALPLSYQPQSRYEPVCGLSLPPSLPLSLFHFHSLIPAPESM